MTNIQCNQYFQFGKHQFSPKNEKIPVSHRNFFHYNIDAERFDFKKYAISALDALR